MCQLLPRKLLTAIFTAITLYILHYLIKAESSLA